MTSLNEKFMQIEGKAPKYDTICKGKSHYSTFLDAIISKNWRKSLKYMTQFVCLSHSISTFLDAKICTKWGNKPPKYDANCINFGDKTLSLGMGVTRFQLFWTQKSAHNEGTNLPNMTQIATILVTKLCLLVWGSLDFNFFGRKNLHEMREHTSQIWRK